MTRAVLLCWALTLIVRAAGWTNSLSVLSLTVPEGESFGVALVKSAVVLSTWFCSVMVAPVMLLSAMAWRLFALSPTLSPSGRGR